MTRAMILAAGLGTRLGELSDERPKPLMPVADVPLIRYGIALCAGHGIREIVVNLHHHAELIQGELGDGSRLGVAISYSHEEKILGTGGGIRRALAQLGDEPFLVLNGKLVFDVDLDAVLAHHRASGAKATLVVRPDDDAQRWGAIDAPPEGGPVRALLGVGPHMFTGVQVLDPELVATLPDDGAERCIIRQGHVPWLNQGVALNAYVAHGYFAEHSTPERYLAGNFAVIRGQAGLRFPPGKLTGIEASAEVHSEAQINPPVRIGPGARIGAYAVVGPDVVVGAYAEVGAGIRLARTVVWPKTHVRQDADGAIMTPRSKLRLSFPPRG
jgi:NDP-sugar pyrophosphorylase family protein